jgi:hypothetical protein
LHGATLPSAAPIAVVVGTWLSLMNQGHLIIHGHVHERMFPKGTIESS